MPIDFAAIARRFQVPIQGQMRELKAAFERLGKSLAKRLKVAQRMETETRSYPVLRYYNDALTVSLDASQRGTLFAASQTPPDAVVAAEGRRRGFLAPLTEPVEQELALPNLLGTLAQIVEGVQASMDRYALPWPGMFALDRRGRAADLFGQAGLALRALHADRLGLFYFALGVDEVRRAFASTATDAEAQTRDLSETLSEGVAVLSGALVLIPIGLELVSATVESVLASTQRLLVARALALEEEAFRMRRRVIDLFFVDLAGFARHALDTVLVLQMMVLHNIRTYSEFLYLFLSGLFPELRRFFTELTTFLNYWLRAAGAIANAVLSFPVVDKWYLTLTVSDLANFLSGDPAAHEQIRRLRDQLESSPTLLRPLWLSEAILILDLLERLYRPVPMPVETGLPPVAPRFPDIAGLFLGPGTPGLAGALRRFSTELPGGASEVLRGGATLLLETGERFRQAATGAATLGSVEGMRQVAARADALALDLFGADAADLRRRIATRAPDQLALAFERAVARGGFPLLEVLVPLYVARMRSYWEPRARHRRQHPTSPHILERRRQVGRVETRKVTLRAPGRALDADLVRQLAARFRDVVGEAFTLGEGQLAAGAGA